MAEATRVAFGTLVEGGMIPPGGVSRPIDFNGVYRGIDRIEMIYRALPTFKGTAEVCVDGLER